jgi:hypothetical protein
VRCEAALQVSFRDGAMGRANVDGPLTPDVSAAARDAGLGGCYVRDGSTSLSAV